MSECVFQSKSKAVAWDLGKGTMKTIDKATSKFYLPMLLQIISNFLCMSFRFFFNWNLSAHAHCWKLNYINLSTFSQETWIVLVFLETSLVDIEINFKKNIWLMELVYCFPKTWWNRFFHITKSKFGDSSFFQLLQYFWKLR